MSKLQAMLCARMLRSCDWLQAVMSADWNALYPTPFMILLPHASRKQHGTWVLILRAEPRERPRSITAHSANRAGIGVDQSRAHRASPRSQGKPQRQVSVQLSCRTYQP